MINKLIKNPHFKWLNLFLRDIFILIPLAYVNYATKFSSKWVYFINGMFVVWVTWQFSDYITSFRRPKLQ